MEIAKIIWSGRSQAVRLPKRFRFDAEYVRIRRHGQSVILEPIAIDWTWLDKIKTIDLDAAESSTEMLKQQDRPMLDQLFE